MSRLFAILALVIALGWTQTAAIGQEATPSPDATGDTDAIGGQGDNVAVAISTKDGSSRFRVSFRIVRTSSDVIDQSNIAFAFASCEQCRSVAIAFQVVLVGGTPSTVIPENYAIALNFECIDCETLASAYQFVLGTDGNVHFSAEGNRALSEIRRAIDSLAKSDLAVDQLQAELDLLATELRGVLADELVASGPEGVEVQEVQDEGVEGEVGGTDTAPTETPGVDPSPTPTTQESSEPATSSPTPEVTAEPAQSPSPTSSSSPSPAPTPVVTASP